MDVSRFQNIISENKRKNTSYAIIGAGSVGSMVTYYLAKSGCTNITVYDNDVVEAENIGPQLYGPIHIGKAKVEALQLIIKGLTGTTITIYKEKCGHFPERDVIFLCTDTIESRKEIVDNSKYDFREGFIDIRTGGTHWEVHVLLDFNSELDNYAKEYEKTLAYDNYAEATCGAKSCTLTNSIAALTAVKRVLLNEYSENEDADTYYRVTGHIKSDENLIKMRDYT